MEIETLKYILEINRRLAKSDELHLTAANNVAKVVEVLSKYELEIVELRRRVVKLENREANKNWTDKDWWPDDH